MTDSVTNVAFGQTGLRKHAVEWHRFLALVLLVTLLPFAVAPLVTHTTLGGEVPAYVYLTMFFFGANFHVALTGWFYTDPEMRTHFRSRPLRYYVIPALLVAGTAAVFGFGGQTVAKYLLVPVGAWQIWHYQKQNVGLLSFVAAGTGDAPLSRWERHTLALAAIAGILGFSVAAGVAPEQLLREARWAHQLGLAVYILVPLAFCAALATTPSLRTNGLRLLFLSIGTLIFAPTFIFSDTLSAFYSYAIAHGLQYVLFMGYVVTGKAASGESLLKLIVIVSCAGIILDRGDEFVHLLGTPWGLAVFGAFTGVTMSHFVLDAGLWRLREPFQRAYMRKRFFFIFDR
jgi:hypothetical protein